MKKALRAIYRHMMAAEVNIKKPLKYIALMPRYFKEYYAVKKMVRKNTPEFAISPCYPTIWDRCSDGGTASGDYFHQDLYVAQKIFQSGVAKHIDVGSRIDGFVAHVATFMPIEILDIRPVCSSAHNISFRQADMMSCDDSMREICDSLSCLHALEHFGLGRYGDPLDSEGHLKGFDSLHKMLKPGGTLYFSVPIGPLRIEFNAHRVFSIDYLLKMFGDRFTVREFSYVDSRGDIHPNTTLTPEGIANNFGCTYGCGIFILIKK